MFNGQAVLPDLNLFGCRSIQLRLSPFFSLEAFWLKPLCLKAVLIEAPLLKLDDWDRAKLSLML